MTEPSHAVFLSHASQDAAAAERIAAALRAGGIEVFLDQSELRIDDTVPGGGQLRRLRVGL